MIAARRSECSLGRRDPGASRVELERVAESAGRRLEDGLADVVSVAAVVQDDVQVHPPVGADRLPEIGDELTVEVPILGDGIATFQTQ